MRIGNRPSRRCLVLMAAASVAGACAAPPPGPRVVGVRPASAPAEVRPGWLVSVSPAVAPAFPTLTLSNDARSEPHLVRGFRLGESGIECRGPLAMIRFWVGQPRPLRVRARGTASSPDPATAPRLVFSVGSRRVATADLSSGRFDMSVEVPADALRPGTNLLSIGRPRVGEGSRRRRPPVAFEEIAIEDAESPRDVAAPVVEIDVEGEASPRRGLWVERPGTLAFLLHPPPSAGHVRFGIHCSAAAGTPGPAFRVEAKGDTASRVLAEGEAAPGRLLWRETELGDLAGGWVRLSLTIDRLPPGGGCAWVEPTVGAVDRTDQPGPTSTRVEGANVIVVIFDAAARDHFGLYGSHEGATDVIDALAPESLVFDRAYTQASYTLASTASLFTGRLPTAHRVTRSNVRPPRTLPRDMPTLAGALADAGYATAMFTGNPNTSRDGLARGFAEVFELYRDQPGITRAEEFRRPVLEWVDRHRDGPFFLYLHYVQPHKPYDAAPARDYRGLDPAYRGVFSGTGAEKRYRGQAPLADADLRQLRHLYDGNLRYPDRELGRLLDALRERGVLDRSILVVSADHGDSLGERGAFGHGHGVDRELVPIPLLLRLPTRVGLTGRRRAPVGNVDVMPTLLDLVGAPVPESLDGRSLLPLREPVEGETWARVVPSWAGGNWATTEAVYGPAYKYVFDSRTLKEALYTVQEQEDGENLRATRPVTFDALAFASYLPGTRAAAEASASDEETPADPRTLEALRVLGYVE